MIVAQSCLTLCDTMGCSLPGSSVHGMLQEKTLVCPTFKLMGLFVCLFVFHIKLFIF